MTSSDDSPALPASRPHCAACDLPLSTCLCALVVRADNRVPVLVLQHPREAREAKGSARLLSRCLARCRVEVGERFEPAALAAWLHGEGRRSVLLYPSDEPDAAIPRSVCDFGEADALQLVVLDATWRKSLRLLREHPALAALPRLGLAPEHAGRYAPLRRARRPGQLSTLEATCEALAALDGDAARYGPVLVAFERFVADRVARTRPA